MGVGIVQRRAAKALRRKATVKEKRRSEADAAEPSWPSLQLSSGEARSEKISAALIDLASWLMPDDCDSDRRYLCFALAAMAWNVSLRPLDERGAEIRRCLEEQFQEASGKTPPLSPQDKEAMFSEMGEVVSALVKRKLAFWPFDRRVIIGFELTETEEEYNVSVMAATHPRK